MPCVMTDEDARYYEREENHVKFGQKVTKAQLLESTACAAFTVLEAHGLVEEPPKWAQLWWAEHKKEDAEREAKR
jgi:hypothetical protein